MFDFLKLSQALNSRLCHEVAGLVGSISTTIELVDGRDRAISAKAVDIINTTSRQLNDVVKFYRMAYGFCSDAKPLSLDEIKSLSQGIVSDKVIMSFAVAKHYNISSELAKVVLCLVISAIKSVIKTGDITISFMQNKDSDIFKIEANSQYLKKDPKKIAILLGETKKHLLSIDNSHEFYTYHLITKSGLNINIEHSDEAVTYLVSANR